MATLNTHNANRPGGNPPAAAQEHISGAWRATLRTNYRILRLHGVDRHMARTVIHGVYLTGVSAASWEAHHARMQERGAA